MANAVRSSITFQAEGQAKFKVSFTPQEAKDHVISVRFNGDPIPGISVN